MGHETQELRMIAGRNLGRLTALQDVHHDWIDGQVVVLPGQARIGPHPQRHSPVRPQLDLIGDQEVAMDGRTDSDECVFGAAEPFELTGDHFQCFDGGIVREPTRPGRRRQADQSLAAYVSRLGHA